MRRHYRSHRESGAPPLAPALMSSPYTVHNYAPNAPHTSYHTYSTTSSTDSSTTDSNDDRSDVVLLDVGTSPRLAPVTLGRSSSHLDAYPMRARDAARRLRSCTIPECDCHEAPVTLF